MEITFLHLIIFTQEHKFTAFLKLQESWKIKETIYNNHRNAKKFYELFTFLPFKRQFLQLRKKINFLFPTNNLKKKIVITMCILKYLWKFYFYRICTHTQRKKKGISSTSLSKHFMEYLSFIQQLRVLRRSGTIQFEHSIWSQPANWSIPDIFQPCTQIIL